jgi:tRNA(Ile)-lysidine synthase
MEPGLQRRSLEAFLQDSGVIELESAHIEQLRRLVATEHPSAESVFPGDVIIRRNYGKLEAGQERACLPTQKLIPGQNLILEEQNLQIHVSEETPEDEAQWIKVFPQGEMELRSRRSGDRITLPGGSKSLKKLFADRKIPAHLRMTIPVVADQNQVLYIHGIGLNKNQNTDNRPLWIKFENKTK